MRRGRRWSGGGIVAGGMVLSFAMIHALLLCSASGVPSSNGALDGGAKLAVEQQERDRLLRQEEDAHLDGASHVPLATSTASSTPEQIHISFAASDVMGEYAVTVAWATWPKAESQVFWGSSAQQPENIAYGSWTSEFWPANGMNVL